MSDDREVDIRIKAQADGIDEAAKETVNELDAVREAVAQLAAAMGEMNKAVTEASKAMKEGGKKGAEGAEDVGEAVEHGAAKGVVMAEVMIELAKKIGEVASEAMEMVREMAEAAEKMVDISEVTGMTIADLQRLQAIGTLTGSSFDSMVGASNRLGMAFSRAQGGAKVYADDFRQLGIDLNKSYSSTELLNAAMAGFAQMEAGPLRTAMAMRIFGRSVSELAPLVSTDAAAMAELNEKIEKYGGINTDAVNIGSHLAETMNEQKYAMAQLGDLLVEGLGPGLTVTTETANDLIGSFLRFATDSDLVKGAFGGIEAALVTAALLLEHTALIISYLGDFTHVTANAMRDSWDEFVIRFTGWMDRIKIDVQTAAQVIALAMVNAFQEAANAAEEGARRIDDSIHKTNAALDDLANRRAGNRREANGIFSAFNAAGATIDATIARRVLDARKGAGADGGGAPVATPPGGGGNAAQRQMQEWQQALRDAEMKMRQDTGAWLADMTEFEIKFWQEKLALATAGSQNYRRIQATITDLQLRQHQRAAQQELAADTLALDEAQDSYAERLRILDRFIDDTGRLYGQDSEQYRNALARKRAELRRHDDEMIRETMETIRMQADVATGEAAANMAIFSAEQSERSAILQARVRLDMTTERQAAAIERQMLEEGIAAQREADQRKHQIEMNAIQREMAVLKNAGRTETDQYRALMRRRAQMEDEFRRGQLVAERQYQAQIQQARVHQLEVTVQIWHARVNQMVSVWGNAVHGLIAGTMSWRDALVSVADAVLGMVIQAIEQMVARWIMNLLFGEAVEKATGGSKIADNAAVAGSAAYSSTAAIPIVGPELAPAAAAMAYAGAMSYMGLLAVSEKGFLQVPGTMGAIIHKDETVLPAWAATSLREVLAQSAGRATGSGRGGHGRGVGSLIINALDGRDVMRVLKQNRKAVTAALQGDMRRSLMLEQL